MEHRHCREAAWQSTEYLRPVERNALWCEVARQYDFDEIHDHPGKFVRRTRVEISRATIESGSRVIALDRLGEFLLTICSDRNVRARLYVLPGDAIVDEFDMQAGLRRFALWDRYPLPLLALGYRNVRLELDRDDAVITAHYVHLDDDTRRTASMEIFIGGPHETHGYFVAYPSLEMESYRRRWIFTNGFATRICRTYERISRRGMKTDGGPRTSLAPRSKRNSSSVLGILRD